MHGPEQGGLVDGPGAVAGLVDHPAAGREAEEGGVVAGDLLAFGDLPDPQSDQSRVKEGHDQWLVVVGICTHLGCIPLAHQGEYEGFFCPCHGSQYDTSGRIRRGPAPNQLAVPPYEFVSDTKIRIG